MTCTINAPIIFRKLNLLAVESIYSTAGEFTEFTHIEPVTENLHVKTFIFKGSKKVEFPDQDQETITRYGPSEINPSPLFIGKKHYITTILEDDTRNYCIQTIRKNYTLDASIVEVSMGDSLDITKGCLIYVYGTSYKLNDIICTEGELFALENNDAKITATSSCKVYIFRAIQNESI
jgi:hypothetical protein